MTPSTALTPLRLGLAVLAAVSLSACGAGERIANIGRAPDMTPIENPTARPGYTPVRLPMPAPQVSERQANSLWQAGARAFFRDQRANQVGDILTVIIQIDDQAKIANQTQRSRNNAEGAQLPNLLGFEANFHNWLPRAVDPAHMTDIGSTSSSQGTGQVQRNEKIQLQLAAVVTQVLPNGNLVIHGRQEVRVNFEARDLEIDGVIRPEDISSTNRIPYEKIAEARISYGGRGQLTDVQQPRYGQQLYDIIFPF